MGSVLTGFLNIWRPMLFLAVIWGILVRVMMKRQAATLARNETRSEAQLQVLREMNERCARLETLLARPS